HVVGLALDVCVKYTVLDSLELGFKTYLIEDACRAVNLQEGDSDKAISEMREKGAIIATSDQIITN
ncbi:MAG: isochorismatase family protein, partial [Mameliella sp.]|nr:isochorismatase family protein [Phaeodactylibacter sp.]